MTTFYKAEGKEELKIHHGSRRHRSQTTAGRQTHRASVRSVVAFQDGDFHIFFISKSHLLSGCQH